MKNDFAYGRFRFKCDENVWRVLMLDDMAFCEENEVIPDTASNCHIPNGVETHHAQMDYDALIALAKVMGEITIISNFKPASMEGDYDSEMYLTAIERQIVSVNTHIAQDGD